MLIGNEKVKERLDQILESGQENHAYLFFGSKMLGKTTFAKYFATGLLCEADKKPCDACSNCILTKSENHPDLFVLDSEETINVEEIRELIRFLDLKPYQARKKVVVIAGAERMTTSAANSFLKTLEEPAKDTIIILTTENPKKLLSTITSRAEQVRFTTCTDDDIRKILEDSFKTVDLERALAFSAGRPGIAKRFTADTDFIKNITERVEAFDAALYSASYFEKIKYAAKQGKEKAELPELLFYLENYYHAKIFSVTEKERLKIVCFLDKLSEIKDLLNKNVNSQLCLESLLFTGDNK